MKNLMNKIRKANKGFTLVELIIVIAIIAVLTAVAAPQYIKYVEKSKVSADAATAAEIVSCAKVIATDTASASFTLTWNKTTAGPVAFAYPTAPATDNTTACQAAVTAALGNKMALPTSKTVLGATGNYVVTATYDATNIAWTFTESIDLTSVAETPAGG